MYCSKVHKECLTTARFTFKLNLRKIKRLKTKFTSWLGVKKPYARYFQQYWSISVLKNVFGGQIVCRTFKWMVLQIQSTARLQKKDCSNVLRKEVQKTLLFLVVVRRVIICTSSYFQTPWNTKLSRITMIQRKWT